MRWVEITLHVPGESVEPVSAVLTESGCGGVVVDDPAAVSSDPFASWEAPPSGAAPSGKVRVSGYVPLDERLESVLDDIEDRLARVREEGLATGDGITLRHVDEDAWADAWKAYFKPQRVGRRFVIKPSWESWDAAAGDLILEIDPGMAFGSGCHPTTRLCLEALEALEALPVSGSRVLDWGTGSGILAVGAALLGAAEVLAVDLDPAAVRVAAENVELNGYAATIRTGVASIEALPDGPAYDLIIANILPDPIIGGAAEIRRRLREGGRALVSGIVDRRAEEVLAALEAADLRLERTLAEEEWRAFVFSG